MTRKKNYSGAAMFVGVDQTLTVRQYLKATEEDCETLGILPKLIATTERQEAKNGLTSESLHYLKVKGETRSHTYGHRYNSQYLIEVETK